MEPIFITDVAPRDGLQNQPIAVSTADKLRLVALLAQAGLRRVEATSFVSPKAVPQMADAADVLAGLQVHSELRVSVLVPNLRGLERAMAAGAREIAVVAASLCDLAQRAGLEIVARLLNLVRIEAEIKLSEIKFRPPAETAPHQEG